MPAMSATLVIAAMADLRFMHPLLYAWVRPKVGASPLQAAAQESIVDESLRSQGRLLARLDWRYGPRKVVSTFMPKSSLPWLNLDKCLLGVEFGVKGRHAKVGGRMKLSREYFGNTGPVLICT
jgi:hypothetical protein